MTNDLVAYTALSNAITVSTISVTRTGQLPDAHPLQCVPHDFLALLRLPSRREAFGNVHCDPIFLLHPGEKRIPVLLL
jgi:hypothetical protein